MKKKLIGFAVFAGAVAVASKALTAKKSEWQGLSESEVREKVETGIPSRVPDDKKAAVADRIVATMRDRGLLETQLTAVPDTDEASDDQPQADEAVPDTDEAADDQPQADEAVPDTDEAADDQLQADEAVPDTDEASDDQPQADEAVPEVEPPSQDS